MQDRAHVVGTLLPVAGGLKGHLLLLRSFGVLCSADVGLCRRVRISLLRLYSNTDETPGTLRIFLPPA